MSIDTLVAEYPGNPAWTRFAETFPLANDRPLLGILDEQLARVLIAELGDQAQAWLNQPVRVLDGHSPTDVLAHHPQGQLAVRTAVMRMPR